MSAETTFPGLLQDFFCRRLVAERGASACTVAGYRDAFELLLRFAERRTCRPPSSLTLADLLAVVLPRDHPAAAERDRRSAGWRDASAAGHVPPPRVAGVLRSHERFSDCNSMSHHTDSVEPA
jgi:hypothetical protein